MIHDREHHLDVLLLQVKSMEVTTAVVTSMLLTGSQNWSIILALSKGTLGSWSVC